MPTATGKIKSATSKRKIKKSAEKALETLMQTDRELFHEVVLEAIEGFVLGDLVLEARRDPNSAARSEIFRILQKHQQTIAETLEDVSLLPAMEKGRKTKLVPREKVLEALRGK